MGSREVIVRWKVKRSVMWLYKMFVKCKHFGEAGGVNLRGSDVDDICMAGHLIMLTPEP